MQLWQGATTTDAPVSRIYRAFTPPEAIRRSL